MRREQASAADVLTYTALAMLLHHASIAAAGRHINNSGPGTSPTPNAQRARTTSNANSPGGAGGASGAGRAGGAAIRQVLVLGYHNTGTSILTKLLMMMGMYAGEPSELSLGGREKPLYHQ